MKSRLMLVFSGTDMTWEDMSVFLQLGASRRHNLRDGNAPHYYYFFDGPAAANSPHHIPVEEIIFDEKNADFMRSAPRKANNAIGYLWRFANGKGTNHLSTAAYDLIKHMIVTKQVTHIDLVGFSRGGNIALIVGALLKKIDDDLKEKLPADFAAHIYAIDPVAGKGRNKEAHQRGELSPHIKKCVIGLAVNESLPGFHPRDALSNTERYQIRFHPKTQFIHLPFPEDHAMNVQWMRDIILNLCPQNSELRSPCNEERMIQRRLGKKEVEWQGKRGIDETLAFRIIHFVKAKEKYVRKLITADVKQGIETCFTYLGTQHSHYNLGHVSLQNEADTESKNREFEGRVIGGRQPSTKSLQEIFAVTNNQKLSLTADRNCKKCLNQYTNRLFINLWHEAMFAQQYPRLHQFLLTWDEALLDTAIEEFEAISEEHYPFTKAYVENALIVKLKLSPITQFKATNVASLQEVLALIVSPAELLKDKDEKKEDSPEKIKESIPCLKPFLISQFFKKTVANVGDSNEAASILNERVQRPFDVLKPYRPDII